MMARLPRFARPRAWLMIVPLVPLVLFTGCRSSGSGDGGCCRGPTPSNPPIAASPSTFAAGAPATAPLASGGGSAIATASPPTTLAAQGPYQGQKTCPVTGEPLGSMGAAIPVTVKGQTIYVCCRGCVAKVQRDPDGYLRKVMAERGEPSHGTSSQNHGPSQSGGCCGGGGGSGGGGCCCHG